MLPILRVLLPVGVVFAGEAFIVQEGTSLLPPTPIDYAVLGVVLGMVLGLVQVLIRVLPIPERNRSGNAGTEKLLGKLELIAKCLADVEQALAKTEAALNANTGVLTLISERQGHAQEELRRATRNLSAGIEDIKRALAA